MASAAVAQPSSEGAEEALEMHAVDEPTTRTLAWVDAVGSREAMVAMTSAVEDGAEAAADLVGKILTSLSEIVTPLSISAPTGPCWRKSTLLVC